MLLGTTSLFAQEKQNSIQVADSFQPEYAALQAELTPFFLGTAHATAAYVPPFFKQRFRPEWRNLTRYGLDRVQQHPAKDRLRLSFSPLLLSAGGFSYHVMFTLFRESIILPQITLSFSHAFSIPLYAVFPGVELNIQTFSPALIFAKSVSDQVKFYVGIRYLNMQGKYRLGVDAFAASLSSAEQPAEVQHDIFENFNYFVIGFSYLPVYNNWENILGVGIDPFTQSFYYRLEFSRRYIALGITFTPESVVMVRPYFRLQFPI